MKKTRKNFIIKIILLYLIILNFILPNFNYVQATENEEIILENQQDNLNIDEFIKEAEKYTKDVYNDINIGDLFTSAISGNIDNASIIRNIFEALSRRSARCNNCSR